MRQLRLADTTESLWDWMQEWAEGQGKSLDHDDDWRGTNAALAEALPSRFIDVLAALNAWKADRIIEQRIRHGQRCVPPLLKLHSPKEEGGEQEEKATGEAWIQMTLFDFVKYGAGLTRGYRRDKVQRDAKIVVWVGEHPASGVTVESLTAEIDLRR